MNCDQICERLPWLLNGTLDGEERREAEQHLDSCPACRKALGDTRLAWEVFDQHVPTEQLVAYAWGDAGGVDRELVEQHLESCSRCTAELELVGISRRLEAAEDHEVPLLVPAARRRPAPARIWRSSAIAASLVGLIAATGWIESSHRMHSLEEAARQATTTPPPAFRGASAEPATGLRQAQARAAELARQNGQLRSETAELRDREKKIEAQISQLEQTAAAGAARKEPDILPNGATASPPPLRSVERGTPAGAAAEVPFAAPYTVLTLASGNEESFDRYELAILDAAGKERRRVRDLHPESSSGQFVIWLSRGVLARGRYTIQLYGVRAGQCVALDSYAIRVD